MKKILLILLSIFFLSCGVKNSNDNEHIFYLDNPTSKNIEITLDGKLYKLKSKTYEVLNLKTGEHIVELSDGTKVYFKIFANSRGGIINPSGASYTIDDSIRYQSSRVSVDWSEPKNTVLSTVDDFIIDKNYIAWEYDIFEEVTDEDRKRAEKIIEDFGITYIKDKYFATLSQGEQRRTLLARAFMNEPDLLILDEPCSGLDVRAREYFLSVLEENSGKENSTPFIYVTHQIEEILPSVSHVALLEKGKIVAQGKKKEILTDKILSEMFKMPVKVVWERERPWLIVK